MIRRTPRPRAARPRVRWTSGLLVAAFAVTLVACDASAINTRLNDYGDNAGAGQLNSGAGGASVRLADDRVVFLANDVYVGSVNGSGVRSSNNRVDNALMVYANINDANAAITTKLGSGGTAYLKPANANNHYRLLSATAGSNDIQVFAAELNSSDTHVATRIIRLAQSNLSTISTVTAPFQANGPEWGTHVVKYPKDNRWYIYGAAPNGATYIARAAPGNIQVPANWEYWTGTTWTSSQSGARAIRDWSGQAVMKHLTPAYHSDGGRFVFVGRTNSTTTGGNTFTFYSSGAPWGPLTTGTTAHTVPTQSCGSGGSVYGFDIASHPHLSDDQASAVFSYARRCTATNTVAAIDRPHYFEVDLADGPVGPRWRASWAEALWLPQANTALADWDHPNGFGTNRSLRQIVHTTRGGSTVRIRVSNHWGDEPLYIGAASIGVSTQAAGTTAALTGTPTPVTFAGQPYVTVPVGHTISSDAVELSTALPSDHDVAITLHFPNGTGRPSVQPVHLETSHVDVGDRTADASGSGFDSTTDDGYFLTGLDVVDAAAGGTVVAFGDSLTNGWGSGDDAEMRWPDRLYDKLVNGGTPVRSVVNLGFSGNKLSPGPTSPNSGLERFERDALANPGVTTVVVWIGFNDLDSGASAASVAGGLQFLVNAIRDSGKKVILGTITPFWGPGATNIDFDKEYQRLLLNAMIRDGDITRVNAVADIDAAVRDPNAGWLVKPAYAWGGVSSHFSPAGNLAIAEAVYSKRSQF